MSATQPPRILVFAGSIRRESYNKRLAHLAAERIAALGGRATFIDLRDYPLPLYDGDLEAEHGLPEHALTLKRLVTDHQALLIASPEYNGAITPLLKNTLDWISRPDADQSGSAPYADTLAAVISASPGSLGGLRAATGLRQLLSQLGVTVLPQTLALARADQAFDDQGGFHDAALSKQLDTVCRALIDTLERLHPG